MEVKKWLQEFYSSHWKEKCSTIGSLFEIYHWLHNLEIISPLQTLQLQFMRQEEKRLSSLVYNIHKYLQTKSANQKNLKSVN